MKRKAHKKNSKIVTLILFIFSMAFLSGCWDVREVNDLAIAISTGIDQLEDNRVEVTFLLYIPNPSGGASGEGSGSSKNTYAISTKGDTFSDAIIELETMMPRRVFWGHSNIFIFGSELAKKGLAEHTDFIFRTVEPREQAQIYVSDGPAKGVLEKFVKINIAELFSKLPKDQFLKSLTLVQTEQFLANHSQAGVIPVSYTDEIETASDTIDTFAINGSAIIHHGKLVDILKGEKDFGSDWIVFPKTVVSLSITPEGSKGKVTAETIKKSYKLIPEIDNGKWKMEVKVKGDFEILQNTTGLDVFNKSVMDQLEREMNEKIKKDIVLFMDHVQKELNADIFQFYEAFHRRYPEELKKEKENWDQKFGDIEVTVKVQSNITKAGVTNLDIKKR